MKKTQTIPSSMDAAALTAQLVVNTFECIIWKVYLREMPHLVVFRERGIEREKENTGENANTRALSREREDFVCYYKYA